MPVHQDTQGPDWPLGFIEVLVPGTRVQITSLVDPTGLDDPAHPNVPGSGATREYTTRFQQIIFQAFKPSAGGMDVNTGNVYIVRSDGNRGDTGTIVKVMVPGETFYLASAPLNRNVFSPYRYYVDADTAHDGLLVVGIVQ